MLILPLLAVAGCGGDDDNGNLFGGNDSGTDSTGTVDHAGDRATPPDTSPDRTDASHEAGGPDQGTTPDGDGAGPDMSSDDGDAALNLDARADGDARLDAPVEAAAPTCTDLVKNGSETDIDCGGSCAPVSKCADGKGCAGAGDCRSGVCTVAKVCAAPACTDTVKNGAETDVDCGGSCAPASKCANSKACSVNGDCQSGICSAKVCIAPNCTNLVKDTNETAVDCGGPDCGPCADGLACALNRDCKNGKCSNLVCTAPSCTDMVKNGSETDVDCGGSCTTKCGLTKLCGMDADCQSGHCPSGTCVECIAASTCPGVDNECQTRTCNNNACGFDYRTTGTPATGQTPGDCHTNRCHGATGILNDVDDSDLPVDGKQCTDDVCMNGTPSNPPLVIGTACAQNGGVFCNGTGDCALQCVVAATCGSDTECLTWTCDVGLCVSHPQPDGTVTPTQIPADCHTNKCHGGISTPDVDDADLPADDTNECTGNACSGGVVSHPALSGTSCNQAPGNHVCSNANDGTCVECNAFTDCLGDETLCHARTCTNHVCGIHNVDNGTPVGAQPPGDCHTNVCNGSGNPENRIDDTDIPVDGNVCTDDLCAGGIASNPTAPKEGAVCTGPQGGRCEGGACTPTFMVVRVGTGAAALTSGATDVFVERRYFDSVGAIVPTGGTIPMPTTANGSNAPLTLSGNATSEGTISLSVNGLYAVLAGYAAIIPTANVAATASATTNRIVGRIDASGNVDTTTRLNTAFTGNNVRGVTSTDGISFWVTGAGGATAGVQFTTFGATGSTQLLGGDGGTAVFATRVPLVVGGQLYASSNNSPNANVFTVGTGTPTTNGQTVTPLPGMPLINGPSPFQFLFFDRDSGVAGLDTLYVADDRTLALGGGIQKWTFNGTIWALQTTFTDGLSSGARGLTGMVTGNTVTLLATTADVTNGNKIVTYVDDNVNMNPAQTVLVNGTAAANTVYRGLALAP